jgi:trehalose 6-phosphate synthase
VPEYQVTRRAAFAAAAEVNEMFGTLDWRPIEIFEEENRSRALALLEAADVLLVNSVADGMNLVAKEGAILNRRDGVLVLSRRAGAWAELGPWALTVDPDDVAGTAGALALALAMPADERRRRADGLRRAVRRSSLDRWLDDQLRDLGVMRAVTAGERDRSRG